MTDYSEPLAPNCLGCQRIEVAAKTLPDGRVVCDRCPIGREEE